MTDGELKSETKQAFRAVMREMDGSLRFDTPEELDVLRANFQTARTRSLVGLLAGGASCGLGWRYAMGRRYSPLVGAWGAIAGMAIGMFSVRQQTFLDLLSIPEDKSPFAYRAREILEREMPESPLLHEIRRRRLELFPRAEDCYDEVVWTEPPPPASKQFATLEETLGQAERDEARFPCDSPGDSLRRSRRNGRQKKRHDDYENEEWAHHATDMGNDGGGKKERKWDEQCQRGSRGF